MDEVELDSAFSVFVRILSGDVDFRQNLGNLAKFFMQNAKQFFFHWITPRDVCARLSSIFAITEIELQRDFSDFVRGLSGDVCFCRNLGKMGEDFHAKRKEFFLHWDVFARFSSIFDIPEVELECLFMMSGRVLDGDGYFR